MNKLLSIDWRRRSCGWRGWWRRWWQLCLLLARGRLALRQLGAELKREHLEHPSEVLCHRWQCGGALAVNLYLHIIPGLVGESRCTEGALKQSYHCVEVVCGERRRCYHLKADVLGRAADRLFWQWR